MMAIGLTGSQQSQGPVDTGMHWLRSAWAKVKAEGQPAAEAVVREGSAKFRAIPAQFDAMATKAAKTYKDMRLEDKKAFILELWRVRQSLNVMVLLDPDVLHEITGIDAKVLRNTIDRANKLYAKLTTALPATR